MILVGDVMKIPFLLYTAFISAFGVWLGGFDALTHAFIMFIIIDYISGVVGALINKKLSSEVGFKGIGKKILMILSVIVAVELNKLIPNIPIREMVLFFYIANEGISILENIGKFAPVPEKFKEYFAQLDKGE